LNICGFKLHKRFILCISVLFLSACQSATPYASSHKEKSITISTEQVSNLTAPMIAPVNPNCERFLSSMEIAEQKTNDQIIPMTMIDAL